MMMNTAREKQCAAISRNSGCGRNAIIFFAIAIAFRSLGILQRAGVMTQYEILNELILPVSFCALMILSIVIFGRHFFRVSLLPMIVCVLFFVLRSLSTDNILGKESEPWTLLIRIAVYIAVSVAYSGAVLSNYRLKWVLAPVFGLGIVYHIVFEDYPAIVQGELSFSPIMMELGLLFILLGMLFVSIGIKARDGIDSTEEKKHRSGKKNRTESENEDKTEPEKVDGAGSDIGEKAEPEPDDKPEQVEETEPEPEITQESESQYADVGLEEPGSGEGKPVLDETYFDVPYKATLTLDPPTDSVSSEENRTEE